MVAVYPELASRTLEVPVSLVNGNLGISLEAEAMAGLLTRMQLSATVSKGSSSGEARLSLQVPPTRSDILHACDVVEDVAIAYGYNNIPKMVSV